MGRLRLGVLWVIAGRIGGLGIGALNTALFARTLSVPLFGSLTLATMTAAVAGGALDMGMTPLILAEAAKDDTKTYVARLARTRARATAVLVLPISTSFLLVGAGKGACYSLGLGIAVGLGVAVQSWFGLPLQVEKRFGYLAVGEVVGRLAQSCGISIALIFEMPGLATVSLLVVPSVVTSLLYWHRVRRFAGTPVHVAELLTLMKRALPSAAVIALGYLNLRIDAFIVELMKGPIALARYGMATRLLDLAVNVPPLFVASVLPTIAARTQDRVQLRSTLAEVLNTLTLMGAFLSACLALCAAPLVALFGGSRYEAAVAPLRLLAPAALFAAVNTLYAQLAVFQKRQRSLLSLSLCLIVIQAVACAVLVPRYGILGAAGVTSVAEGLGAAAVWSIVRTGMPQAGLLSIRASVVVLLGGVLLDVVVHQPIVTFVTLGLAGVAIGIDARASMRRIGLA